MIKALASTSLILVVLLLIWGAASPPDAGSQSGNVDYDKDDDGLIEISNLEQLDAIRLDLYGEGEAVAPIDPRAYTRAYKEATRAYKAAFPGAEPGMGCPIAGLRQKKRQKVPGVRTNQASGLPGPSQLRLQLGQPRVDGAYGRVRVASHWFRLSEKERTGRLRISSHV